ncbi:hypothetical protein ALC57_06038 [Trachymyrmex cornetzi]|uniref:Uncharacterized protein n=1 Tax=Trachymyrmex cornetzi TaxID=471704 RepID=A0A151J967_9HYME|nr:hypothetical protein ALC57_06038 [Trachymyrmex cornetzi]
MDVENVPMDIDGLSMLKSSSSSSWVNRRERRRPLPCCAPMPLSCLDDNNARTMRYNRRTRDVTLDRRLRNALLFNI